jgi:hypothetical protein
LIDRGQLLEIGTPNDVVNRYTKILFSTEENQMIEISNKHNVEFKGANTQQLDKSLQEYRYGSQEGIIEDIKILKVNNEPSITYSSCEEMIIRMIVTAKKDIERPIYALTIKSIKGLEVYGTNSYYQNMPFNSLRPGDTVEIEFRQSLALIPGNYFLSFGFVELVNGDIVPLDRRYDAVELKIMPRGRDRSFGIANLESSIHVRQAAYGGLSVEDR